MARRIQTKYRQYRAKKLLEKKKKEKQDYEELMEKLEKEVAWKIFTLFSASVIAPKTGNLFVAWIN